MMSETAGLADLNAYHNIWFLRKQYPGADALLSVYPKLCAWEARMVAIGHGDMTIMEASEALDVARDATSDTATGEDPNDPSGRKPGDRLSVMPDDSGKVPVTGELVSSGPHHIALRRGDDRVGEVVVHFPRAGYRVLPARD
jgi:hypothetical protein